MDVEPLVASDLPPAPTEAAPVSAEIVAPSLPATGKKKKRDGAARNGRQPQAGAPHPGRPEPPNVRDAIMARSGVIDISPALEIKLGAPLDVIIAPCAEIAKIRHATAALVVAAMVSVSMGRAFIRHGLSRRIERWYPACRWPLSARIRPGPPAISPCKWRCRSKRSSPPMRRAPERNRTPTSSVTSPPLARPAVTNSRP